MTSANRNDPCPCGSGRKYKKCHGAPVPIGIGAGDGALSIVRRSEFARASACKTLDVQLHDVLVSWAHRHLGAAWVQRAAADFSFDDEPKVHDAEGMLLGTWMCYHMAVSDTDPMPLAHRWREEQRLHREPAKARLVEAHLNAPIGVWEVQSVERGVGSQVKDLLSGDERFVYDAASTESLQPWLSLLGYVVDCDGISFFGGLHLQPLPPSEVDEVVRAVRKAARVRTRPVPLNFREDPDCQLDVIDQWRMAVERMAGAAQARVMHNGDGDLISLQSDRFDVTGTREEILQWLATIPDAEPPERDGTQDVIAIVRESVPGSAIIGPVVVGRVVLSGRTLTAETNSLKRADTLKAAIEYAAGNAVRYRLRKTESMESLRDGATATAGTNVGAAPSESNPFMSTSEMPPEVREAMRQLMAKHDAQWPDTNIPALGNVTPRAAAKDAKLRPKLELLLKDMEARQHASDDGMGMDIAAIRRELGV